MLSIRHYDEYFIGNTTAKKTFYHKKNQGKYKKTC